jgi:hypothetical protein
MFGHSQGAEIGGRHVRVVFTSTIRSQGLPGSWGYRRPIFTSPVRAGLNAEPLSTTMAPRYSEGVAARTAGINSSENNMAAFRELEQLVARIQQQLAPKARVIHNTKLRGRQTQSMRQIDVLVTDKVAQFDINIVIECKDYKRPVDVKGVEEFAGLLNDVGAQKGVLVCPKGFTDTAKIRAEGFQIDLYSPFDTDPHKWQVRPTIPALCDFRTAAIAFGVMMSAPLPMRMLPNFFNNDVFSKRTGEKLGTIAGCAVERWNSGGFPTDAGTHDNLAIFDEEVTADNGYGMQAPMHLYVGLHVTRELYFGQQPITKISGFKDEIKGGVIANAFQFGMLDPDEVEKSWKKIENEAEAPTRPVISMTGLVGWIEPQSEEIMKGLF